MEQREPYVLDKHANFSPEQLLVDAAEKRPGTFIIAAAAVGLGVIGLIGYSISKGRKLKIDMKKMDITLD